MAGASCTSRYQDGDDLLKAMKEGRWRALGDASAELKGDRKTILEAVGYHGNALQFASEELRADHDVVMKAVSTNAGALVFASEEPRSDPRILMKAVSQDGETLMYASEGLRNDREIVLTAVSQDWRAIEYASEELKADKEIEKAVFKRGGDQVIGVHARLLSGRSCIQYFNRKKSKYAVMRDFARLLDLDPEYVRRMGKLVQSREIFLIGLQPGRMHEVTLVLLS